MQKKPVRLLTRSSTFELVLPLSDTNAISVSNGVVAEICNRIYNPKNNGWKILFPESHLYIVQTD